jgi:hypothetical protein
MQGYQKLFAEYPTYQAMDIVQDWPSVSVSHWTERDLGFSATAPLQLRFVDANATMDNAMNMQDGSSNSSNSNTSPMGVLMSGYVDPLAGVAGMNAMPMGFWHVALILVVVALIQRAKF